MRLSWLLISIAPLLYSIENEEEALFLRRIADFWQEGEYQIAKSQIEQFIFQFPESSYTDTLSAALGDLALREKNFSQALQYYAQIQSEELLDRVFLSRMHCLYEMQWYANLADECETYLQKNPNLQVTYFLAIALYHQCLNATKDPEMLQKLANRAKPYFETLSQSELSDEVAQGFAHLCCILKDFSKAAQIYLDLAKKNPEEEEDMLFQAALIQSEFDQESALHTFNQVVKLGKNRSKEAAYNALVLAFEAGRDVSTVSWENLPADKQGMAHLFLGRGLLNEKKYPEALRELELYLVEAAPSETFHAALLSYLEAAFQASDLAALDQGLSKLTEVYPEDKELPKVYFSRAQLLKKQQNIGGARAQIEQLLERFPECEQKPQALFERAHLDYQAKLWESCYQKSAHFLSQFPGHELTPFAWRYFISASAELANENASLKEQLVVDLEKFLAQEAFATEKGEWQFLLAKTEYELGHYEKAIEVLKEDSSANALLLTALCYREGFAEGEKFSKWAELALEKGQNLVSPGSLHLSLFNAYLQGEQIEKAADHLYHAFLAKTEIKTENLLWLANLYFHRLESEETNIALAERTAQILEKLKNKGALNSTDSALTSCKAALHYQLAKVYSLLGKIDEEITLLEKLEEPNEESLLLLAEGYVKKGALTKAAQLFDQIVATSATVRSPASASAALQSARLKLLEKNPNLPEVAASLKNLVLQKTLLNEPTHLEAALDYIDLQSHSDGAKKMALLQKTKNDFERTDDLLSKDYHAARLQNPSKNQIYQGYMRLMEAALLLEQAKGVEDLEEQKHLQAKSKDLLLQIVNEPVSQALFKRAQVLLSDEKK